MNFFATILFCFLAVCASAQSQYYVLFEYNKAMVPDTAMAYLVKTIYTNNVKQIYLEGHCDSIGSRQYNYKLSQKRVHAVEQILIDNDFKKSKIHGKVGFGKDKPLLPNHNDASRQKNRRVLVKFVFDINEQTQKATAKKANLSEVNTARKVKKDSTKKNQLVVKKIIQTKKNTPNPHVAKRPKPLKIENFKPNNTIALPNLLFQGGRHFLINQSTASLDTLIKILRKKPKLRIEIQGHVCCTTFEADGYDWDTRTDNLSTNRAAAIRHYLIKNGISSIRLKTKGFGGSRKLFPNEENKYQKQQNRRVEVMVLPN